MNADYTSRYHVVNAQADAQRMEANWRRQRTRPYHESERNGYDKNHRVPEPEMQHRPPLKILLRSPPRGLQHFHRISNDGDLPVPA